MSAKADQSGQESRAVEGAPLSVSTRIGVVVERRPSQNRWIDEVWMPVAVIPGLEAGEPWQVMREADGVRTYLACTLSLSLHRAEVEAYKLNLSETAPKVLIVLVAGRNRRYALHGDAGDLRALRGGGVSDGRRGNRRAGTHAPGNHRLGEAFHRQPLPRGTVRETPARPRRRRWSITSSARIRSSTGPAATPPPARKP